MFTINYSSAKNFSGTFRRNDEVVEKTRSSAHLIGKVRVRGFGAVRFVVKSSVRDLVFPT